MIQTNNYKFSNFTNFLDFYSDKNKNKTFYMSDNKKTEISYSEQLIIIKNFQILLKKYKIKNQEKIMVICDNGDDLVLIFLSILYHKLIFVPVNPNVVKSEFIYLKNITKPKLIITNKKISKKLNIKKNIFLIEY